MTPAPPYVAPALALVSGVMLCAALHHLFIGIRRPQERVYLIFAALSVFAAAWAIWGIPLYGATTSEAYVHATRWRQAMGFTMGPLLLWFIAEYTGVRPRAFLWSLTAVQLVLLGLDLVQPYTLYFSGPPQLTFSRLPWGEQLTAALGPRGPLFTVTVVVTTLNFVFGMWASVKMWRRGERAGAVPLFLVLVLILLGLYGFALPFMPTIPGGEIAFLGLVLVMSLTVSNRVVEAASVREALAQSEQRLRTLVEAAPEAVLLLDADTGAALEANDQALELFGRERSALGELYPGAASPPEQEDGEPSIVTFERRMQDARLGGRPVFRWVVRSGGGASVPCEARLVRLPGTDPAMVRLSLVDVRVLEEAEARQSELEAQLRQAQRMEALGRLTGGVAHDFNNLLTVIRGNLELLIEAPHPPLEARELVDQALMAAGRSADLTRRLLAFSRRQTLEPRPIDMTETARAVVAMLGRTLGENIELEVRIAPDLRVFFADPAQLESALVNLAINARDAMPEGGRIRFEAHNVDIDAAGNGWREPFAEGSYVAISVRDDGEGMEPDVLRRAMDPFFTTKPVGQGSGLGLAVVYGFVTQSGGTVRVESERGGGTRVHLLFPTSVS